MKRIRYVSQFSTPMTHDELEDLAEVSARNNHVLGITGILVASGELFYQLIEGPDDAVDSVFGAILTDDRHRNVLTLSAEQGELTRLCPDWNMQHVDLAYEHSAKAELAKASLDAIFKLHHVLSGLVTALEDYTWQGLLDAAVSDAASPEKTR